jgi:hypothetical protein
MTFPIFDHFSIHAREAGQAATIRAESARYQRIATDLRAHWNAAAASLVGVVPSSYPVDLIHLFTSGPQEAVIQVAVRPEM